MAAGLRENAIDNPRLELQACPARNAPNHRAEFLSREAGERQILNQAIKRVLLIPHPRTAKPLTVKPCDGEAEMPWILLIKAAHPRQDLHAVDDPIIEEQLLIFVEGDDEPPVAGDAP